jgi:hypothetical protein
MSKAQPAMKPQMSDDAVQAKTGKNWKEWFAVLDKAGARKMSHQEIVKYLNTNEGVGPWWQQMVTVTYERARGLRDLHQKPSGYEISISRTVDAQCVAQRRWCGGPESHAEQMRAADVARRHDHRSLRFLAEGKQDSSCRATKQTS